jgi:hypothetical protein
MRIQKIKKFYIALSIILVMMFASPVTFAANKHNVLTPKTKVEKESELQNVFKRFLKTMLWVAGSVVGLYFVLLILKKFSTTKVSVEPEIDLDKNLASPETVDDATQFVIKKF